MLQLFRAFGKKTMKLFVLLLYCRIRMVPCRDKYPIRSWLFFFKWKWFSSKYVSYCIPCFQIGRYLNIIDNLMNWWYKKDYRLAFSWTITGRMQVFRRKLGDFVWKYASSNLMNIKILKLYFWIFKLSLPVLKGNVAILILM